MAKKEKSGGRVECSGWPGSHGKKEGGRGRTPGWEGEWGVEDSHKPSILLRYKSKRQGEVGGGTVKNEPREGQNGPYLLSVPNVGDRERDLFYGKESRAMGDCSSPLIPQAIKK